MRFDYIYFPFLNALKCDFDTLILEKVPTVGGGYAPASHTLPPLDRFAPTHATPIIPPPNRENKSTPMPVATLVERGKSLEGGPYIPYLPCMRYHEHQRMHKCMIWSWNIDVFDSGHAESKNFLLVFKLLYIHVLGSSWLILLKYIQSQSNSMVVGLICCVHDLEKFISVMFFDWFVI